MGGVKVRLDGRSPFVNYNKHPLKEKKAAKCRKVFSEEMTNAGNLASQLCQIERI